MTRRWRLIAGIGSIAVAGVAVASLDRVREALDGSRSETDPEDPGTGVESRGLGVAGDPSLAARSRAGSSLQHDPAASSASTLLALRCLRGWAQASVVNCATLARAGAGPVLPRFLALAAGQPERQELCGLMKDLARGCPPSVPLEAAGWLHPQLCTAADAAAAGEGALLHASLTAFAACVRRRGPGDGVPPALLKGTVLPLLHRISAGGNEGPRRPVATVVRALAMTGALDPAARDAWAETVLGWARHAAGEPSGEADAATLRRSARACQPFTLALESLVEAGCRAGLYAWLAEMVVALSFVVQPYGEEALAAVMTALASDEARRAWLLRMGVLRALRLVLAAQEGPPADDAEAGWTAPGLAGGGTLTLALAQQAARLLSLLGTPLMDVVFVHGIRGGAFATWRQEGSPRPGKGAAFEHHACWPAAWLSEELPEARLLTVEYAAPASGWEGESLPFEHTVAQLAGMLLDAGVGARPTVFVCHSMGGVLVKELLAQAQAKENGHAWHKLACNTLGLVSYAVPHSGSRLADLGWQLRYVGGFPAGAVAHLKTSELHLEDVNAAVRGMHRRGGLAVLSFGEGKPTRVAYIKTLVVPLESAYPGYGEFFVLPSHDHISACKPTDRSDAAYAKALDFLGRTVYQTMQTVSMQLQKSPAVHEEVWLYCSPAILEA
ncbi:Protein SERAC1 [Auxenochlorella protothecoides]|uniref:Protein SERAC1 n=1 Tax=Auxenochlorella protothecoides TaxID=3075 RepID=A0A087SIW4_AUXPR|nr:Protein SERAC1 [Auxenochlorella protothecoides]KFM25668.1 Protein SERAC1 [Auxenochlorella protothecoides]